MSSYEIVPYQPELKAAVVDLWQAAFDADGSEKRKYLEWKYERNPYILEPILFVALTGTGRVVGTRGFHGSRWQTPDGSTVIPCAEDFAIAQDQRNSGLATAIMRVALDDLAQRGYEYTMSGSGGRTTVLNSLAMGWKSIGPMEPVGHLARHGQARLFIDRISRRVRRMWRPGRLSRTVYATLRSERPFERLERLAGRHSAERNGSIVVESSPSPTALADLVARLPRDDRIRHVRDPAFFEWRYANPSREYLFLLSEREGRVDGYMAIARSYPLPFQIVDWEGTSHEVRARLLEFALSHGGFTGLGAWTASLSDESKELLERMAFRPTELDLRARGMPCVLLKKLGATGTWSIAGVPALRQSNWDIRLVDSMHG